MEEPQLKPHRHSLSKTNKKKTKRNKTTAKQTYALNQDHLLNFIVHEEPQQVEGKNFKCTLQSDGLTPHRPNESVSTLATPWTRVER